MLNRKAQVAIILASTLTASSAFAWRGECHEQYQDDHFRLEQRNCYGQQGHHRMRGEFGRKHIAGWMEREFTADEIRILQSAKLIMKGNPNLKVGKVKAENDGYHVTIVTRDNSLVEELSLAKNGMRQDRYQRIVKRLEATNK